MQREKNMEKRGTGKTYSMLPCINAQKRLELTDDWILIGIGTNTDLSGRGIFDKPSPTTSLDSGKGGIEFLFEILQTPVCGVDGLLELARWWSASASGFRGQILPE